MNYTKNIIFFLLITSSFLITTNGYLFGLKSFDNTITNIKQIEETYDIEIPLVSFIFDPRDGGTIHTMKALAEELGTGRIYHLTVSPHCSAKEVAEGCFDKEYKEFFKIIKDYNLKVVFRTMHEMNGGWYPRGSSPENFQNARIHVRNLSRDAGLDTSNILFDMSVNHWDMPTKGVPNQAAHLIQCRPEKKYTTIIEKEQIGTQIIQETIKKRVAKPSTNIGSSLFNDNITVYQIQEEIVEKEVPIYRTTETKEQYCYTFEDYYPGDKYVDIMGVTFYNRGKASYSRARLSPQQIMYDTSWKTMERLKSLNKPIIIDEVATTAVWYYEPFDFTKSFDVFTYDNGERKNQRLYQLKDFLNNEQSIVGFAYFNVDYTNGLTHHMVGEADRAAINLETNKTYSAIFDLYKEAEPLEKNKLFSLFGSTPTSGYPIEQLAEKISEKYDTDDILKRLEPLRKSKNKKLQSLVSELIDWFEKEI